MKLQASPLCDSLVKPNPRNPVTIHAKSPSPNANAAAIPQTSYKDNGCDGVALLLCLTILTSHFMFDRQLVLLRLS